LPIANKIRFYNVQRELWEMNDLIEVLIFGQSMNLLWFLELWCLINPKQFGNNPKLSKSVSIRVIFPPKAETTFSNMAMKWSWHEGIKKLFFIMCSY